MKQDKLAMEYVPIDSIKPYEKNPRLNKEAVPILAKSINDFGFLVPIVVDKDGVIAAGHTRYLASLELGLKEVPVIRASGLTKKQIKAYRLADNKVAELAGWDFDLLDDELSDLEDDFDMEDYGFIMDGFDDVQDDEDLMSDEVAVRESAPSEPRQRPEQKADDAFDIHPGDAVRMGRHMLVCAPPDSTDAIDYLLDGDDAELAFSEPFPERLHQAGPCLDAVLPRVGAAAIAYPLGESAKAGFASLISDHADTFKTMLYRGRPQDLKSPGRLMPSVDPVPVFSSSDVTDVFSHDPGTWTGFVDCRDIWSSQFAKAVITALTGDAETVLDCFGGMGYTLEACEASGRRCLMLEEDPVSCSAIASMYAALTGTKEGISIIRDAV